MLQIAVKPKTTINHWFLMHRCGFMLNKKKQLQQKAPIKLSKRRRAKKNRKTFSYRKVQFGNQHSWHELFFVRQILLVRPESKLHLAIVNTRILPCFQYKLDKFTHNFCRWECLNLFPLYSSSSARSNINTSNTK